MEIEDLLPKSIFSQEDDIKSFRMDVPFSENGINFVAIDLETATMDRNSICEIGIAIVENSAIKETKSWLVQPPYNEYDAFNIFIHGITPEDTANSPSFKEIWKQVEPYVTGKVVVAHNTAFDMYVLRDSFLENDVSIPHFINFCSCRLARKVVTGIYSYSLPNVCEALGIDFCNHHKAASDAEGCAKVFLECVRLSEATSFASLQDKYNFRCGRFSDKYFRPQLANHGKHRDGYTYDYNIKGIVGNPEKIDEGSYFYGKHVCFTGKCQFAIRKELLQMVADIGGIPMNSVTMQTDILVVGQQEYKVVGEGGMSSKQEKAVAMIDKGYDIEIMSETEFLSNMSISKK